MRHTDLNVIAVEGNVENFVKKSQSKIAMHLQSRKSSRYSVIFFSDKIRDGLMRRVRGNGFAQNLKENRPED